MKNFVFIMVLLAWHPRLLFFLLVQLTVFPPLLFFDPAGQRQAWETVSTVLNVNFENKGTDGLLLLQC